MYENYTRQSLPSKEYRELLGTALCVFNSNNAFIIENIIRTDASFDWYDLIDKESGFLIGVAHNTITHNSRNSDIANLFSDLIKMRNRIIHSFQITSNDGEQILATKTRKNDGNVQFYISKDYLMKFINKNEEFSDLLNQYRDNSMKFNSY